MTGVLEWLCEILHGIMIVVLVFDGEIMELGRASLGFSEKNPYRQIYIQLLHVTVNGLGLI